MIDKETERRLNRIEQAVGLPKGITEPPTGKIQSSIVGPLVELPEEEEGLDINDLLRRVAEMIEARFSNLQGDVYEIFEEYISNENILNEARTFINITSPKIHKAYVKTTPGAVTVIACYLDTDATGEEITVNCHISGGGNLNSCIRRLVDGNSLEVVKHGSSWYALEGFQASEDCVCSS